MDKEKIYEDLVKTHWNSLVWRLSWRGLDVERAKEFVQEAFLRLFQRMESNEQIDSPKAWLIRVSENLYKDHLKSGEAMREESSDDGELPEFEDSKNTQIEAIRPDEVSNSVWIQICVDENIKLFAEKYPERSIAIMLQLDEKSIATIAKVLDRTEQATRKFLSESKKKLDSFLMPCKELIV